MEAKRDLFDELVEGFNALREQRDATRTLPTARVEVTPAPLKRQQAVAAATHLSEHQPDSTLNARQTT